MTVEIRIVDFEFRNWNFEFRLEVDSIVIRKEIERHDKKQLQNCLADVAQAENVLRNKNWRFCTEHCSLFIDRVVYKG